MVATSTCASPVCDIHTVVGYAIVGGFAVLLLWGGLAMLVRTNPNQWFWRLLAVLQVLLIAQVVAGLVLLVLGGRQPFLHYMYGSVFPALVLVVAHVLGRGMEDPRDAWKVFAVASFFVFGLTLRALATGLGMG